MRSTNYPVKHQLATSGEFNIYRQDCDGENKQIFKGKAYINENIPGSGIVDIADIARHDISLDDVVLPEFQEQDGNIFNPSDRAQTAITHIVYGNGIYVAALNYRQNVVGQLGWYYSNDAVNWNFVQSDRSIYSITFGNNLFVAVMITYLYTYQIMYSSDGVNWNSGTNITLGNTFSEIIYRNGTFMLFTNYELKYYSTNGTNWSTGGSSSTSRGMDITRGEFDTVNNRWSQLYSNTATIESNTNELHWSTTNLVTTYSTEKVFYPFTLGSVLYNGNLAIFGTYPKGDGTGEPSICTAIIKNSTIISADVLPSNNLDYERSIIGDRNGTHWYNIRYNEVANMYVACDVAYGQYAISYDAYNWTLFHSALDNVYDVWIEDSGELKLVGSLNNNPAIQTTIIQDLVNIPTKQVQDYYIDNNPATYTLAYDYNTIYQSQIGDFRINNDPILNEVVRRQLLPISFYDKQCNRSKSISFNNNGQQMASGSSSGRSAHVWSELSLEGLSIGDIITASVTITDGGEQQTGPSYRVIDDCKVRYVVYYVNKLGGIDTLPIKGNTVESFTNSQFSIDHEYDRGNPEDHQYKVIQNTALRRWQMNTGLLTNREAQKIDHLLLTPKCWVHDLNEEIIYSARIYDTGFSVKKFVDNVQFANYTFNIEQAQDIIRRG